MENELEEPDQQTVILYHDLCPDGFGAAYAAWKKFGDKANYIPVNHTNPPPNNLDGKDVYLVDFAYKRSQLLDLKAKTKSLIVIDHHITTQEDLKGLNFVHFDMNHSGATQSWRYFFDSQPPELLQYIEDRDLWKFKLENSETILAAVDSYPYDFQIWDQLCSLSHEEMSEKFLSEGKTILRYKEQLFNKILRHQYTAVINGKEVPVVNSPVFNSEIGDYLSKDKDFAAIYYFNGEKYIFSLRSRKSDGDNVEKVAKTFGGGGHKTSSGFSTDNLDFLHLQNKK